MQWALVKREKIIKFLEKHGWTLELLAKQDEKIRNQGFVKTKEFIDDVSFRYSDNYIEKPINILLKKDTYLKLSELNGIIEAQTMKQVVRKSRSEANNVSNVKPIYTLLVDGNSLLKMSLVDKRMNDKGEEYGAVYLFLT